MPTKNMKEPAGVVMAGGALHDGLTKLEYFTAMAMQGLCANPGYVYEYEKLCTDAVVIAEKTLAAIDAKMEK